MKQYSPGIFRSFSGINIADTASFANTVGNPPYNQNGVVAQKTPGATLIDQLQFAQGATSPLPSQNWTLLSVSITANLFIAFEDGTSVGLGITPVALQFPFANKFGKILAGMILQEGATQTGFQVGGASSPFNPRIQSIPTDESIVASLWDPSVDDLPPIVSNASLVPANIAVTSAPHNQLQVSCVVSPPVPIQLIPGVPIYAGIWMLPSVWGGTANLTVSPSETNIGLLIQGASYNINYDDGL